MTSHRARAEKLYSDILKSRVHDDWLVFILEFASEIEAQALERAAKWVDEAMECDYCQGEYYSDGIRALKEPV